MIRLAFVLPTIGRPTLRRALASLTTGGVRPEDELWLMVDGPDFERAARRALAVARPACHVEVVVKEERTGGVGGILRNEALEGIARRGSATHVLYIDDDDAYADGALDEVRPYLEEEPHALHMFKMDGPGYGVIWKRENMHVGNVGGPMFVHPVNPARTGRWDGERCQDQRFMVETAGHYGGEDAVRWHGEVIYLVRDRARKATEGGMSEYAYATDGLYYHKSQLRPLASGAYEAKPGAVPGELPDGGSGTYRTKVIVPDTATKPTEPEPAMEVAADEPPSLEVDAAEDAPPARDSSAGRRGRSGR